MAFDSSRPLLQAIAEGDTEPGVTIADIDPAEVATARARIVGRTRSPMSDVDAGEHVASPMPTPSRATMS